MHQTWLFRLWDVDNEFIRMRSNAIYLNKEPIILLKF
jgi:hypothetical protein